MATSTAGAVVRKFSWASLVLFWLVVVAEFAAGYYVSCKIGYVHSDAMSRVANAFYVLYSHDPHLAAIGFVWNPLPSLADLLVLLLYPWFPSLASAGLAGVVMSALFAGCTAVVLVRTCRYFGLPTWLCYVFSLSFSFNPFMFLFGANGLSDSPFILFIVFSTAQLTFWFHDRKVGSLIKLAFGLALAFWTRYEAVPFGAAVAAGILIAIFFISQSVGNWPREKLRAKYAKAEGTLALTMAPIVYSGLMWIFFNYIIMGDPLYFLRSEYSNVAQAEGLASDQTFALMMGNPLLCLIFVIRKTLFYSIPLAGVLVLRIVNRRGKLMELLVLLLLFSSILALQFLLLYKGTSYGWFRYFMYVFPITVAWLPYELSKVKRGFFNVSIVLISLWASAALLTYAMTNPQIAPDENKFLHAAQYAQAQSADKEVAEYLDTQLGDAKILMDSYSAYAVILNSRHPQRYLITSDLQFHEALLHPQENGVDYILSPKPDKSSALSADNSIYPDFYEKGAPWCTLYKEFGGRWRLYKVNKQEVPK